MRILILADIHGNREALGAVLENIAEFHISQLILLGDLIDYGPHSNEILHMLRMVDFPILCNIRGNHEQAVLEEDYNRFSSDRGQACARYTRSILNSGSWDYIRSCMAAGGQMEFEVDGKKCLAVHGCLQDEYWKAIGPSDDLEAYRPYDYVFSGHSHLPHYFEKYYQADCPDTRNRKKTVFLNPGSVGQPRNLNANAQFAIWDTQTGEVRMACVSYDIRREQSFFSDQVDPFYCMRLEKGI